MEEVYNRSEGTVKEELILEGVEPRLAKQGKQSLATKRCQASIRPMKD
jgi:hypothetical protein